MSLLALSLSGMIGCSAGKESSRAGDSDTGDSGTGDSALTVWYTGTSQGQLPDGSYVEAPKELLFIRRLDPDAATITEEVWSDEGREWQYYSLVHAVDAAAGTFTSEFVTSDGTLDVVGAYDAGEAWAWTAWHSASIYRDGEYTGWSVQSQDSMDGKGVATADKHILDAAGAPSWDILEVLTPISEEDFNVLLEATSP